MDPKLQEYLQQRQSELAQAQQQAADSAPSPWLQALAGFGDAVAGRSPQGTAERFNAIRQQNAAAIMNPVLQKQAMDAAATKDYTLQQEAGQSAKASDPNSAQSQAFRNTVSQLYPQIAAAHGDNFGKLTSTDLDMILKPVQFDQKLKDDEAQRKENMDMKREAARAKVEEKAAAKTDKSDKDTGKLADSTQSLLEQLRGSPAAAQAEKDDYAAQKAQSLVNMYKDPNKLSNQQVQLLASEVSKIASGGVPTMHELEGLSPQTLTSKFAATMSKLTNNPTPANAGAFVKQYYDYTKALAKDSHKVIKDRYERILLPRKDRLGAHYQDLSDKYIGRFDAEPSEAEAAAPSDKPSWAK